MKPLTREQLEALEVEALELAALLPMAGQPYVARELGRARPLWRLLERLSEEELRGRAGQPVKSVLATLARFVGGEWPLDRLLRLLARWPAPFARAFFDAVSRDEVGQRSSVRIARGALAAVRKAARGDARRAARLLAALASAPDAEWGGRVRAAVETFGEPAFREVAWALLDPEVREGVPWDLGDRVIWTTGIFGTPEALRSLADTAEKDARSGSPHPRVALAVVRALGLAPVETALPLLERLAQRVRHRVVLREVARAKEALAARAETTTLDLEERTVPTHGLVDGRVTVEGVTVTLEGTRARVPGKPTKKNAPARRVARAIEQTLSVQRARLEQAMVDERRWAPEGWAASFVAHPLLAPLARGVLWQTDGGVGFSSDDGLRGLGGAPLPGEVRLAHPATLDPGVLERARAALVALGRAQPWKQLFRETYVVTSRERREAECLRFEGEVVPLARLYALAKGRGWSGFSGMGPRGNEGTRAFASGLRARLELLPARSRVFEDAVRLGPLRFEVKTGRQVEERLLGDVPPVAFSEACRDLDLVVGVASLGEDAAWVAWEEARRLGAGDPDRLALYDRALAQTAESRGHLLALVLPRLGLGARVEVAGRFARVRGELNAYRVHLGSGNVHVDPSGRFIAWPEGGTKGPEVWLPEEAALDPRTVEIVRRIQVLAHDALATDPELAAQLAEA